MNAYRRVTFADRCHINAYLKSKLSLAEIARLTGFHKSSISREIKRNSSQVYNPQAAQRLSSERFKRCRRKLKIVGELESLVCEKIIGKWSPEQLCGRLRREVKKR